MNKDVYIGMIYEHNYMQYHHMASRTLGQGTGCNPKVQGG